MEAAEGVTSAQAGPNRLQKLRLRLENLASSRDVLNDFWFGAGSYRFWWQLSLNDVRGRYRRTLLGPWWLVFGNGIALGAMAFVWSQLFGMALKEFFPYLVSGYITWMMIVSHITEGCSVFTGGSAATIQRNIPLPKSVHALRLVSRSMLLFAHNFVVFIVVALVYDTPVSIWSLAFLPGIFMVGINGVWLSIVLGIFGARYRDFEPLVGALIMFLFLITPIMWHADMLGQRGYVATFNPFTHLIAVVREPLLGHPPPVGSWIVVCGLTVAGYALAFLLMKHGKHKIVFWL
jgi:ABC-type polysaccharide/polyol phosphate export permease